MLGNQSGVHNQNTKCTTYICLRSQPDRIRVICRFINRLGYASVCINIELPKAEIERCTFVYSTYSMYNSHFIFKKKKAAGLCNVLQESCFGNGLGASLLLREPLKLSRINVWTMHGTRNSARAAGNWKRHIPGEHFSCIH